jgi:hypothetical protein
MSGMRIFRHISMPDESLLLGVPLEETGIGVTDGLSLAQSVGASAQGDV